MRNVQLLTLVYKFSFVPIIIGALGYIRNDLYKNRNTAVFQERTK